MEKIKRIIFSKEQLDEFECMKLDFETIFQDEILERKKKKKQKYVSQEQLDDLSLKQSISENRKEIFKKYLF